MQAPSQAKRVWGWSTVQSFAELYRAEAACPKGHNSGQKLLLRGENLPLEVGEGDTGETHGGAGAQNLRGSPPMPQVYPLSALSTDISRPSYQPGPQHLPRIKRSHR